MGIVLVLVFQTIISFDFNNLRVQRECLLKKKEKEEREEESEKGGKKRMRRKEEVEREEREKVQTLVITT